MGWAPAPRGVGAHFIFKEPELAITAHASGSQTAVISTEHTLTDVAVAGAFILYVDAINMASGDTTDLRVYAKILTGGTLRVAYVVSYTGAQSADDLIKISVPISNDLVEAASLRFTLKQTAGTGRVFPWKVVIHS